MDLLMSSLCVPCFSGILSFRLKGAVGNHAFLGFEKGGTRCYSASPTGRNKGFTYPKCITFPHISILKRIFGWSNFPES
jgi:hypothetical protein